MQKLHQASQNQLFAIQSASEEESVGRQTELELASTELERATERLAALEREKRQLVVRLAEQAEDRAAAAPPQPPPANQASAEESLRTDLSLQREVRRGGTYCLPASSHFISSYAYSLHLFFSQPDPPATLVTFLHHPPLARRSPPGCGRRSPV